MTILEAIERMQATAEAAKERLACYGFKLSVEVDYMNSLLKPVETPQKAKFITVSLVCTGEGVKPGEEYCMSIGTETRLGRVSENQLNRDIEGFKKMVDDTVTTLDSYEDKNEGLAFLVAKATEECEKLLTKLKEDEKRNKRVTIVSNVVFWVGVLILFVVALLRQ